MSRELAGRAVVVTGAGAGLGRSYALACSAAGAMVVVNDVVGENAARVVDEITAAGASAAAHVGTVGTWDGAGEAVATALEKFGRLDGLVANAGVKHEALPWEESEASLRRIHEVNVLGVQFCGVHAMRAMVDAGRGGAIVTVVSGARLGIPLMSAYGATKGAVAAMTTGWAVDGAPHRIRANAISPLAETAMAATDHRSDRAPLGSPDDVAPLVVALLSDATAGVSGRTLRYDGSTLGEYEVPPLQRLPRAHAQGRPTAQALAEILARSRRTSS